MADERLKILMIAPTPFFADRGCHVRIYEEARTLIGLGHQVQIATYHLGREMKGVPTIRIRNVPWYGKLGPGPSWHKPYLDLLLFFKTLSAARKFRPDIIHAHLHEGAFIGMLLRKLRGIPLLFDCQGSLTREMIDHGFIRNSSIPYRFFHRVERMIDENADFIITSSGAGEGTLKDGLNVSMERVEAVIDGVDTDIFKLCPKADIRRKLGIPADRQMVVFLGVLNEYQGIDILLETIRLLKGKKTAPHFLVMGFPEEGYRKRAEEMGIGPCVTFTGRIDYADVPYYICAGDIAVSPKISRTEANGKLLNYMACGVPSVVFDSPVNREILGDCGVYARFGDPEDLANCIAELLADSRKMDSLAAMVRERAVAVHSWKSRGERIESIYRRLINYACQ